MKITVFNEQGDTIYIGTPEQLSADLSELQYKTEQVKEWQKKCNLMSADLARLAEYDKQIAEGLEPLLQPTIQFRAGITDGIHLNRLEEICNAEKDGRCQVLPCKVGSTIWDRHAQEWQVTEINDFGSGKILLRCGYQGTSNYCALWLNYGEAYFTRPEAEAALTPQTVKIDSMNPPNGVQTC